MAPVIAEESPLGEDLVLLFERHTADMHADTPPGSIHMMDRGALAAPGIRFFVLRDGGQPLAMGAFKRIGPDHAEIKSMRTTRAARGSGVGARLLAHLLEQARAAGYARLSLETGSEDFFAPARGLYARHGFVECEPFADYTHDPLSVYMTREL